LNAVGPSSATDVSSFCQTSSSPKARRVGIPPAVCRVGSGAIQRLYQACAPGSTPGAPIIAVPVAGLRAIVLSSPMSVQVAPKSAETYTPCRTVALNGFGSVTGRSTIDC
jgi:hypothetical protein